MKREPIEDFVVVLPGIPGSRLAKDGKEVWGASAGPVWRAVRTFGGSVKQLTLPRDLGDDHPKDGVEPVGLMPTLHALPGVWPLVQGYSDLLGWLERTFTLRRVLPGQEDAAANLVEFAYDWRLSCRYNAGLLAKTVAEGLGRWRESAPQRAEAQVVFVCHSMGGLIARYYVECLGGTEVTRRLITLGTPHRGSMGALKTLVNGHRIGLGPLSANLSGFARSLPSLHQLTPEYACIEAPAGLRYPREITGGLPGVDPALLEDAGRFHAEIRTAALARARSNLEGARCLPVSGVQQPTATTAVLQGEQVATLESIEGRDEGGDGRVPRFAAIPAEVALGDPATGTPSEQHGTLHNNGGVRDGLFGWLGRAPLTYRGPTPVFSVAVRVADYLPPGQALRVEAEVVAQARGADELAVQTTATGEDGQVLQRTLRNLGGGRYAGEFPAPAPGAYEARVRASKEPSGAVTALVLVGGIQ